jgi:hypothetical protein
MPEVSGHVTELGRLLHVEPYRLIQALSAMSVADEPGITFLGKACWRLSADVVERGFGSDGHLNPPPVDPGDGWQMYPEVAAASVHIPRVSGEQAAAIADELARRVHTSPEHWRPITEVDDGPSTYMT